MLKKTASLLRLKFSNTTVKLFFTVTGNDVLLSLRKSRVSLRRFVKDSDAAEKENLPLSGMIVRDRRLVPIYPTSGMRYPPIIVALSRDLESNLSIRWKGTWYPIAPSASERDSTSRHFSSNFHESVASACWRTSERAYYTKCFPSVFSA